MRDGKRHSLAGPAGQGGWLQQRVQISRGHWRWEEQSGAARGAGWWESVTVTWSPTAPPRRSTLPHRTLTAAVDTLAPALAELLAAGAWRLLDRWQSARALGPSSRRRLPTRVRALPRAD